MVLLEFSIIRLIIEWVDINNRFFYLNISTYWSGISKYKINEMYELKFE